MKYFAAFVAGPTTAMRYHTDGMKIFHRDEVSGQSPQDINTHPQNRKFIFNLLKMLALRSVRIGAFSISALAGGLPTSSLGQTLE